LIRELGLRKFTRKGTPFAAAGSEKETSLNQDCFWTCCGDRKWPISLRLQLKASCGSDTQIPLTICPPGLKRRSCPAPALGPASQVMITIVFTGMELLVLNVLPKDCINSTINLSSNRSYHSFRGKRLSRRTEAAFDFVIHKTSLEPDHHSIEGAPRPASSPGINQCGFWQFGFRT
jgi:hypothetical protein